MAHAKPKFRLGIAGKVYLGGLAVLVFGFLVYLTIAWLIATDQAQSYISDEIDQGIVEMDNDLSREMARLSFIGDSLTSQKDFVALVKSRNTTELGRTLTPLLETKIVDSVTVADAQSIVLLHLGEGQAVKQGDDLEGQPGVIKVLSGSSMSELKPGPQGTLQVSYWLPLHADGSPKPVGILLLVCYLDNALLEPSLKGGIAQRMVVYDGQVVASTLNQSNGKPWLDQTAPAEVLHAEHDGVASPVVSMMTDRGEYLFKFVPLESPNHTVLGMYGAGVSQASLLAQRTRLVGSFAVGFMIALLTMSVIGFTLGRTLTRPVRSLETAVRKMAAGDLSRRIERQSNDELGDLADQVEVMRQQLREALDLSLHQQSHYAAAIHNMGVAAVFTDPNHRITSANEKAEQLLKQEESQLVGCPWQKVFVTDERSDATIPYSWSLAQGNGSGGSTLVHGRFPLAARPDLVLDIVSSPIELGDELTGYIHILQDVSAQEQFTRTKDDFVLNVAHELRGPLSSLRVSVELLSEDYPTMTKQEIGVMLRNLRKVIIRFQGLVESLVDVGNIQAGRFRVHAMPSSVEDLVGDAVARVQPLCEARSQQLVTHVESPSAVVLADPRRIQQVLVNLLTNASKYGPEDCLITLATYQQDDQVCFSVADQGQGIPIEDQPYVFERFFRVKRTDEEGTGIGIGLALAKGIIQAHGGSIHLKSEPGKGTTFWFSLPRVLSENEPWNTSVLTAEGLDEDTLGG